MSTNSTTSSHSNGPAPLEDTSWNRVSRSGDGTPPLSPKSSASNLSKLGQYTEALPSRDSGTRTSSGVPHIYVEDADSRAK